MNSETQTASRAIDFSAFSLPVSEQDVAAFKAAYPGKTGMHSPIKTAIIVGLVVFFIAAIPALGYSSENSSITPLIVWFLVSLGGAAIGHKVVATSNEAIVRLGKFASANNATLIFKVKNPLYDGVIFSEGHSRLLDQALQLPGIGEIGSYQYTTGSGKNRSVHRWTYAKITLARTLPHMVIDSKKNNFLGISNLAVTFDRSQALSLEGDFDKHFTLYTPKQYERDALYVFTPDVMAALIDHGTSYDIEIVGNQLYIYQQGAAVYGSQKQLEPMLDIIERIGGQVKKQTAYYADQKINDRTQNIVAPQGARLKRGVNYVVLGIIVLFVTDGLLGFIWPEASSITSVLVGIGFWGVILYGIALQVKRSRIR